MKNMLLSLMCLFLLQSIAAAQKNKTIYISAFKSVYVELPSGYNIIDLDEGLSDYYFKAEKVRDGLFTIKANTNEEFPPSNITVVCSNALFQADIIPRHSTTVYNYSFSEDEGIIFSSGSNSAESESSSADGGKNRKKVEENRPVDNSEKYANTGEIPLDVFEEDRSVFPQRFGNIDFWFNNIYTSDKYIYISFKIRNNSSIKFVNDYIQFFVVNKKTKSKALTIKEGNVPLSFQPYNDFKEYIDSGETALFVCRIESFSISKKDKLQVLIQEGGDGRRSLLHDISSKDFYKAATQY